MVPQISVQLYSLREQAAVDYAGTIRAIAKMGFENVEPAGYPGTSVEEAAKLFADLGLKAPSCHGALPIGENKNQVIDDALTMGHQYVITGCPPDFKENYASADKVKAMVDLYCEAAENTAPHGLQVGYHNHDWDLVAVDGKPGYHYFLEGTPDSILWEADLFWVARAGIDPASFVKEIGVRGKCLHFKDGVVRAAAAVEVETAAGKVTVDDEVPFLPAGVGEVDLVAAAHAADDMEYAVVELDSYAGDMMKAVAESYSYLTSKGIATGRK
ncbi:MAG: sugar phosphate isomerase/epimerase [Verrucomicrobia bacterium]|jgi:sugar phosphate isomerase/epimerase|nr:sugar phosphate isomerase/epimerase [Verrucomicrobiota bacterium]